MSKPEPSYSPHKSSVRWLWFTKIMAVALSLLWAFPMLPFVGEMQLNFATATFFIALVGLVPGFGWTIPSLINGFWLTPMLFAFRVNGSSSEDFTAAIAGGIIGLLVGLVMDIHRHQTVLQIAQPTPSVPPPNSSNAG